MNKDWLDISVLEDYLDGKLDAKAMNRVEREALDDPFVAEALAGLSESPKRSLQSISLLQKQLHERVAEHQSFKRTSVITWQRLSIAAAAAVIFVSVSVMFWMKENNYQKQLAGRAKKVDVTIAPAPSEDKPPVVADAPVIASRKDVVKQQEIDRAIEAAKTNSYAVKAKKKTSLPTAVAAPQQMNEVMIAAEKNEAVMDSPVANAVLAKRAAGVQIRGTSTLSQKSPMISNPIGGWDKLWAYIQQNSRFKNEEKVGQIVELEFKIGKDGTPEDLKVLKEADVKYEEEAIRLILNGPKWEQPLKTDSKMIFRIDF